MSSVNDPNPVQSIGTGKLLPPREMTNALLEALVEKLSTSVKSAGLTPEQLEIILTKVGLSTAEGMRQTLRPENAECTHISAYFTERDKAKYGSFDRKPALRRKTFFIGAQEKDERLTPAEIEAYNAITDYRTARNGLWKAEIRQNGQEQELWVSVPCDTVDERMDIPSLVLILHELNGGVSTKDIHSLIRQIEALKTMSLSHGATATELEAAMLAEV